MLDTALRLLDAEGVEALTMPMVLWSTIYDSLAALIDALLADAGRGGPPARQ